MASISHAPRKTATTSAAPGKSGRRSTGRFEATIIVAVVALATLASAATFFALYAGTRDAIRDVTAATEIQAGASILALESSIENEIQALRDLAASRDLADANLKGFHTEIVAFGRKRNRHVVLFDLTRNEQVLNSAQEFGVPLGPGIKFAAGSKGRTFDRVFVSNLTYAPLILKQVVVVAIPVAVKGQSHFILGLAIEPGELLRTLQDAQIDAETISSISDRNGVILARTQEHSRFTGRKAPSNVTLRPADKGSYRGINLDGRPVIVSYAKSAVTGWAVVSVKGYEDAFVHDLALAALSALAVLVAALVSIVAFRASRRRAR